MIKNKLTLLLILISFLTGAFLYREYIIYRNKHKPVVKKVKQNLHPSDYEIPRVKKWLVNYQDGMPVFSDRNYYNRLKTQQFDSCLLLSIPRHDTLPTILISNQSLKIFRLIPSAPLSIEFKKWLPNWENENFNVNVIGGFKSQNHVVSKRFIANDTITLLPSGIKSSTPILIQPTNKKGLKLKILQ